MKVTPIIAGDLGMVFKSLEEVAIRRIIKIIHTIPLIKSGWIRRHLLPVVTLTSFQKAKVKAVWMSIIKAVWVVPAYVVIVILVKVIVEVIIIFVKVVLKRKYFWCNNPDIDDIKCDFSNVLYFSFQIFFLRFLLLKMFFPITYSSRNDLKYYIWSWWADEEGGILFLFYFRLMESVTAAYLYPDCAGNRYLIKW